MSQGRHSRRPQPKRSKAPLIVAIIALLLLVGGGGFLIGKIVSAKKATQVQESASKVSSSQKLETEAPTQSTSSEPESVDVGSGFGTSASGSTNTKQSDASQSAQQPQAQAPTPQPDASKPLAGKVIAIDPGHQAKGDFSGEPIGPGASEKKPKVASGTQGIVTRIPESKTVLEIALKLRDALEKKGATVVMTRTSQNVNVANSKRAEIANDAHADLLLRLHCDGNASQSLQGISTLIPASNKWTTPIVAQSKIAGNDIHKALIAATGAKSRGVAQRSDLSGFNWCKVPAVLVEMGFMTNPQEDRSLNSAAYQEKLVDGLVQGCISYLSGK